MKYFNRVLTLLLALLLCMPLATAETTEEIVAIVNGEPITMTEYSQIGSALLAQYEELGVDLSNETVYNYILDQALTYAIEQMLLLQDMAAQGCDVLDAEEEAWCAEQGRLAWESALADVGEMMREALGLTADEDVSEYALAYAEALGVTEQTYVEEYRLQLAMVAYYEWLLDGEGITADDVEAAYETRVADSRAMYENDVAAFETAVSNGGEVWFMPEGYRSVLQILLPAQGETEAEKLASVQATMDEIYARLEAGETFQSLIAEFGADTAFEDEAFFETGYQVHRESAMWEDVFVATAFSEEMAAPGCWSQPFVSDLGIHILYYLGDQPGGAVALTEEVYDALAYVIYSERSQAALTERMNLLADTAEVVIY